MNITNITQATEWFEVLRTTGRSQAAVMRLDPGKATGEHAESHAESEQLLLLIEGVLAAEIDSECFTMNTGDMVIIPVGIKHKFANPGATIAVTFNVYCPPEYSPDEKGCDHWSDVKFTKRRAYANGTA
jgi:mannose-6-phosphate isomerase-like protein (cupin superfamily)